MGWGTLLGTAMPNPFAELLAEPRHPLESVRFQVCWFAHHSRMARRLEAPFGQQGCAGILFSTSWATRMRRPSDISEKENHTNTMNQYSLGKYRCLLMSLFQLRAPSHVVQNLLLVPWYWQEINCWVNCVHSRSEV